MKKFYQLVLFFLFLIICIACQHSENNLISRSDVQTAPQLSSNTPPKRAYHSMVFDSYRQVVVMFGGREGLDEAFGDTWEYDGQGWRQIETIESPPTRYGHGMAFDSNRNVTVLYGGVASLTQRFADTWEYDGENWFLQDGLSKTPGGREFPIMIFDPSRQATLLLVGAMLDDMWSYDGEQWQKTSVVVPPPIRFAITTRGVFDGRRQVLILHEGSDTGWGDTSELINNVWEPVATRGDQMGRGLFDLVFDSRRGVIVLFGGKFCEREKDESELEFDCHPVNDTWEYDGKEWHQLKFSLSPPARYGHAMVYDEAKGVVVLFGGIGLDGDPLNDTWEYDGIVWAQK